MDKFFYDFHIHSALSPCSDDDMTPNNIVNMAKLKGLDIIAITDHNCTKNVSAVVEVGAKNGLLVLPGMELQTSEDIHILCLFENVQNAVAFGDFIYKNMALIKNRADIYGQQLILDQADNIIAMESNLLVVSSNISIDTVPQIINNYGGVAVMAHIDRMSNGAIAALGSIDYDLGYNFVELSKSCSENFLMQHPYIQSRYNILHNSDAHYLWDISERKNYIELSELTAENVLKYLSTVKR